MNFIAFGKAVLGVAFIAGLTIVAKITPGAIEINVPTSLTRKARVDSIVASLTLCIEDILAFYVFALAIVLGVAVLTSVAHAHVRDATCAMGIVATFALIILQ